MKMFLIWHLIAGVIAAILTGLEIKKYDPGPLLDDFSDYVVALILVLCGFLSLLFVFVMIFVDGD